MRLLQVGLVLLTFLSTCQNEKTDKGDIVVSVYGKNLYRTDMEDLFYDGMSYNDSVIKSKVYIDKWVRDQLLIRQAEDNLQPQQLDFTKRLEEYRNSLVINKYETELVNQKLDTEITEDQILEYYNANIDDFRLNRNIVRYAVVNIQKDSKKRRMFTSLLRNHDTLMVDSITSLADKYAIDYDFNVDRWCDLDETVKKFNLKIKDNKSLLNENKYLLVNNDDISTLIRFYECRFVGDISPSELETERIRYIILNNRKKDLLEKLYDDLYSKALQDEAFVVY